jgi:glycosyltransferase involved in cell wall biosynthesis
MFGPLASTARRDGLPVSVGVTVDLELTEDAGGHVKCWQRMAEAAVGLERLDLTVYFLGAQDRTIALGGNARYRLVPPQRGTRALGIAKSPAHTDLAARNLAVEPALAAHDVLHVTAPFALSGSARHVAAARRLPLAGSVHTNNPAFARIYFTDVLSSLAGPSRALSATARWLGLPKLAEVAMARRVTRCLRGARHLFYSNPRQREAFRLSHPLVRLSRLRRGIDRRRFNPGLRDRQRLSALYGIPPERPVVTFAGRIDASKNADLVFAAAQQLWSEGLDFTLLMLGEGTLRREMESKGGMRTVLPGLLPQDEIAWLLASTDVFVFPSETETVGNVALEALACGLPRVAMAGTAPAETVQDDGRDGLLVAGRDPAAWAATIAPLLANPGRLAWHRGAARLAAASLPSWREVLEQDLLPIWQALAAPASPRSGHIACLGKALQPAR